MHADLPENIQGLFEGALLLHVHADWRGLMHGANLVVDADGE